MSDILSAEKKSDRLIEGDFLNRQEFINRLKTVIELLSSNKKNTCFAVSGSWGIGKSYVLDNFEKQLLFEQDGKTALDKYFVFHFNCWEYDYYEEPLIAIISAMLDEIANKEHIFSPSARSHVVSAAKFVFTELYEGASKWVESKTGINPKKITDELSDIHKNATKNTDKDHQYDKYLDFKQALLTLREEIKEISKERTIVFVVDELDRCIPEYQIKVLERLHHIFNGIENIQVILAVDKAQLERTVQKMFGENVETQKYLAKFIKFEIELDEGTYNSQFEESLGYYFNMFEVIDEANVVEFKEKIFEGIAIRERIEIVENCYLLHNLLNKTDKKMNAFFMCLEVFMTVLKHTNPTLPNQYTGIDFYDMFGEDSIAGLKFLQEKMSRSIQGFNGKEWAYCQSYGNCHYIKPIDLWGLLLACYAIVTETQSVGFGETRNGVPNAENYINQFWSLLQIIK